MLKSNYHDIFINTNHFLNQRGQIFYLYLSNISPFNNLHGCHPFPIRAIMKMVQCPSFDYETRRFNQLRVNLVMIPKQT